MNLLKLKNIIKLLFIDKKSSRFSALFLIITTILIPIDFLSLWMIANFTRLLASGGNQLFSQDSSLFIPWIQYLNIQSYGIILLTLLLITFCLKYYQFYLSHFISGYIDSVLSIKSFKRILNLRIFRLC